MVGALCSWPSATSVHSTSRDTHTTHHTATQGGTIKNLHSLKAFMKFFSDGILDIQICRASMWPNWCFACLGHHISCRNMDILHWKVLCLDTGQTPRWMFGQTINLVLLIETVEPLVTVSVTRQSSGAGCSRQQESSQILLILLRLKFIFACNSYFAVGEFAVFCENLHILAIYFSQISTEAFINN